MRYLLATAVISLLANQTIAQDKLTQQFYFASDSFNITHSHGAGLARIERELKANPYYRIRIDGNTDSVGDRSYNYELSKKRIKSIRDAMVGMGLKPNRIKTQPKGEDWPVFNNGSDLGKSRNRRVDVYILLDRDSCFKDGCAQTCIPKGTFDPHFTNEIAIKFIPITNVDQMRANNISAQTVDGGYLFSSGMIRVTATFKGIPVYPQKPVKLRIPAYKLDETFSIWEGSTARNLDVNWKEKKMEMVRGKGDCAYFEIDGSFLNRWINIDKPRPPGNMICVDNPFSYLEMPAVDSDTSKVIQDDIVLSLPGNAFSAEDFPKVEVVSDRVNTLCQMLNMRMTSKIDNEQFLGKEKDILHIAGFEMNGVSVSPDMASFNVYFPATKKLEGSQFYVASKGMNDEWIWTNAGKADSVYTIEGCSCKYLVKQFDYPTQFINISSDEQTPEPAKTQKLQIKKFQPDELYVYDRRNKRLSMLQSDADGKYDISMEEEPEKLVIIGRYTRNGVDYVFDGRLNQFRKRWFVNERVVKAKAYKPVDQKRGLVLKSVSCRSKV